ncbi:hypothetical protein [Pelagicoccus sp. SDUM812002]|uniref:hypothetical protein n=1 Tax=Pelagicoccus sp. SDUM812002 TaxID=3041266 RepID=UPI00280FA2EA|nr:hypothetical protein [Pelagicoccus sp. SDUM812002]MDQ8188033.1 hypothetical protein [Pelagicoccus sp. SDUM812002]
MSSPSLLFPPRFLGIVLAASLCSWTFTALAGPRTGEERRLLPISGWVGGEAAASISKQWDDTVLVTYQTHKTWYDLEGNIRWEANKDSDIVYSPDAGQQIDFSVPGLVIVRDWASGAVVERYEAPVSDSRFLDGFVSREGEVCHSYFSCGDFSRMGWVSFVSKTGEILWTDESGAWNYRALGAGAVLVRYSHLVHLPEARYKYWGPVNETLHHVLTGEPVLPEEVGDGWLVPQIAPSGRAIYVSDSIWAVDTVDGSYEKAGEFEGRVRGRIAAQSINGEAIVALTVVEDGTDTERFRLAAWSDAEDEPLFYEWQEEWGDPENVDTVAISDDAVSILMGFEDGSALSFDTEDLSFSILREAVPVFVDPFYHTSYAPFLYFVGSGDHVLISGAAAAMDIDSFDNPSYGHRWEVSVLNLETKEVLRQTHLAQRSLFGVDLEAGADEALYVAYDGTPRALDLYTLEEVVFDAQSNPRISHVWPADDDGVATIFFLDGTKQAYDSESGELVGERSSLLPDGVRVIEGKPELGLLVGSDGCVYRVDTGEVDFELEAMLESEHLREEYKDLVRELLENPSLRAELLEEGSKVAFFISRADGADTAGLVTVFEVETKAFVELREYDWKELVENEEFIVAVEKNRGANRGSPYKVGVFDADKNLAEIYSVAADQSVRVAPDGRHFAVLTTDTEAEDSTYSAYEVEVRLREFALGKNGFSELEPTVWKETYASGEFETNVPVLLEYEGPGKPVLTHPLKGRVLEMRSGGIAELPEVSNASWFGSQVIDRLANGRLMILNPQGRLGLYASFAPRAVPTELLMSSDGFVEPNLTPYEQDQIEVWWSVDLVDWKLWNGEPLKVLIDYPVFWTVYYWEVAD